MSWNNRFAALVFGLMMMGGCIQPVIATEACPVRNEAALRFVDVFDGDPEELATLVPDEATQQSGHWQLGYVYDAGRLVTIRCKYADGKTSDVKLSNKVNRCAYKLDSKKTLSLRCE